MRRLLYSLIVIGLSPAALVAAPEPAGDDRSAIDRLMTLLDLDRPDLAEVKAAHEAGRPKEAMHALAEHYRRRFPREAIKPKVINNVHRDADMALEFRFRSRPSNKYYKLHEDFDWYNRPAEIDDHHWLSLLVSLHQLQFLADVYIKTGEERYAAGCQRVFDDWLEHCPPGSGSPSWSLATTMIRSGVLLRVFERMIQWRGWPPEARARMLASIYDHVDMMQARRGPGNQDATNSEHLMRLASGLPEFKDARHWLSTGYERISERIFEDVLPDGTQRELTSGYHLNAVNTYTLAARRLREFGRPMSPEYAERLEKMYKWCLVMIRPDGSAPINGDSAGSGLRPYLANGAELFGRPDMRYAATQGEAGTPPDFLDGALPVAGYYTMRSSWTDPQGLYLFLDASRQPVVSHQDYDALHVNLFAYGRNFFPDKGTYTYGGDYHKQAKATVNHTTVAIDGENQADVPAVCHGFQSNETFAFIDAGQQGYEGVAHRRQVVFVRPAEGVLSYFLLIDRITDRGKHTVDQIFHLAPGPKPRRPNAAAVETVYPEGPNLRIEQLRGANVATQWIETEMHPRQGKTVLRPGVRFRREGALPALFVTLLLPYPGSEKPDLSAATLAAAVDGDVRVRIDQGGARHVVSVPGDTQSGRCTLQRTKD